MGLFDFLKPKVGRDEFAARAMARLQAMGWPHPMTYDRESFRIELGGEGGALHLGRIFEAWSTYPRREQAAALDEAVAFVFDVEPKSFEEARDMLLPIILSRAVWEEFVHGEEVGAPFDMAGAGKPLTSELVIHVAVDRPRSTVTVNANQLRDWGCGFDEVLEVAMGNIQRRPPVAFVRLRDGFHQSTGEDYYAISQLLRPDLFKTGAIRGLPVVIPLSPDCLLLAGSEEPKAIEAMARYASMLVDELSRPVSFTPLTLGDDGWETYQPREGLKGIQTLFALQQAQDYKDVTGVVVNRLELLGRPRGASTLELFPTPEGAASLALWVEAETLLPRADYILIQTGQGPTLVRRWEDVEAAVDGFVRETTAAIPFFATSGWPSEAALERIELAPEPEWAKGRGIRVVDHRISIFG